MQTDKPLSEMFSAEGESQGQAEMQGGVSSGAEPRYSSRGGRAGLYEGEAELVSGSSGLHTWERAGHHLLLEYEEET